MTDQRNQPTTDQTGTEDTKSLERRIVEQIKTVYDPEIPVNIFELGLIYGIEINGRDVEIQMTLTSPACPVAGILPLQVETKVKSLEGVNACKVELVWEPAWSPGMMTEAAQLKLNIDDPSATHGHVKRVYDINIDPGA
jgi:FeS assembly SUF system protein